MKKIHTAFVLGAGLGTRLRPLTEHCPKPLLPINGRPMVEQVFARLAKAGIQRIIVNTHHAAERWTHVFPDHAWQGIPLIFRHEPILLGTAGGLKNIADLIKDEIILLHSGDVVTDLSLAKLCAAHFATTAEATLALRDSNIKAIGVDDHGVIRQVGKPSADELQRLAWYDYANVAVIEPAFLQRIPDTQPRGLAEIWRNMAQEKVDGLRGCLCNDGAWHNIGTLEEYQRFNKTPQPSPE